MCKYPDAMRNLLEIYRIAVHGWLMDLGITYVHMLYFPDMFHRNGKHTDAQFPFPYP